MSLAVTILGCGSSGGVPRLGGGWGACDPENPMNRRRRCSILVEQSANNDSGITRVLVDTSPDLRQQLLDLEVDRLDAILLSHSHADHIHGMDDVRPLVIHNHKRIDLYMDQATSDVVKAGFGYIFETPPGSQYAPMLTEKRLQPGRGAALDGPGGVVDVMPFLVHHGEIDALGFRFGNIAYTPDLIDIPPESIAALEGLDVWIIDALRHIPHPSHFSLAQALEWVARMKPRRAILTNMHNDLDYETLRRQLPDGVEPGFDGMRVEA